MPWMIRPSKTMAVRVRVEGSGIDGHLYVQGTDVVGPIKAVHRAQKESRSSVGNHNELRLPSIRPPVSDEEDLLEQWR